MRIFKLKNWIKFIVSFKGSSIKSSFVFQQTNRPQKSPVEHFKFPEFNLSSFEFSILRNFWLDRDFVESKREFTEDLISR